MWFWKSCGVMLGSSPITLWTSWGSCSAVRLGEIFHSNTTGSQSILSSSRYGVEPTIHPILSAKNFLELGYSGGLPPRRSTDSEKTFNFTVNNVTARSCTKILFNRIHSLNFKLLLEDKILRRRNRCSAQRPKFLHSVFRDVRQPSRMQSWIFTMVPYRCQPGPCRLPLGNKTSGAHCLRLSIYATSRGYILRLWWTKFRLVAHSSGPARGLSVPLFLFESACCTWELDTMIVFWFLRARRTQNWTTYSRIPRAVQSRTWPRHWWRPVGSHSEQISRKPRFCSHAFIFSSSSLFFLHLPLRHGKRVTLIVWMDARKHRLSHNIEQLEKMVPFVASECAYAQHVCQLVSSVDIFDLDLWILSINQSGATLWVRDTCLIVGHLPLMIILITTSLSSKMYNWDSPWEECAFVVT